MNKKFVIPIALVVLILLLAGAGYAYMRSKNNSSTQDQATNTKKVLEPVNQLAINERPYLRIMPEADGHYITLVVEELKKPATELEYELEYQSGTLLQGFQGLLQLDNLPTEDTKLMGSKSAGGAVTYHEDIKGGNILTRFMGEEKYVLKQDWRYFDNKTKETEFSSKDAKFQIESKDLASQRFLIIFNSPGYPGKPEGRVVSETYTLDGASALKGQGTLSLVAKEEGNLTILGYNGKSWQKFDTKSEGKTASATVDLMQTYLVVASN